MKILFPRIFFLLFTVTSVLAAAGFTPADLASDARNTGLGRLGVAAGGESFSFSANPSLLASSEGPGFFAGIQPWLFDTRFASGGAVLPLGRLAFGAQLSTFGTDPFEVIGPSGIKSGSSLLAGETFLTAATAFRFVDSPVFKWSVGVEGLLSLTKTGDVSGTGMDLGAGTSASWKINAHEIRLGLSFLNPLQASAPGSRGWALVAGLETEWVISKDFILSPGLEFQYRQQAEAFRTSVETRLFKLIALRFGFAPFQSETIFSPISAGIGLRIGWFGLDYAFHPSSDATLSVHSISAIFMFRPKNIPAKSPEKPVSSAPVVKETPAAPEKKTPPPTAEEAPPTPKSEKTETKPEAKTEIKADPATQEAPPPATVSTNVSGGTNQGP